MLYMYICIFWDSHFQRLDVYIFNFVFLGFLVSHFQRLDVYIFNFGFFMILWTCPNWEICVFMRFWYILCVYGMLCVCGVGWKCVCVWCVLGWNGWPGAQSLIPEQCVSPQFPNLSYITRTHKLNRYSRTRCGGIWHKIWMTPARDQKKQGILIKSNSKNRICGFGAPGIV